MRREGALSIVLAGGGQKGRDAGGPIKIDQLGGGKDLIGLTSLAKSPVDGTGTDAELLNGVLNGPDLGLHFGHQGFKRTELLLGAFEDSPDFVPLLLDGEHMEAHLEARENGGESARPGDGDPALSLDLALQ